MRAHFGLPSVQAGMDSYIQVNMCTCDSNNSWHWFCISAEETEKRPPINISFEIPYFTVSGIQVRYLKIVEKSGYQALPWVRYITQNGGMLSAGDDQLP